MKYAKIWVESIYNKSAILRKIKKASFVISKKRPDFVLTYGGDGHILQAEWKYPGVPKIPIMKSMICVKCDYYHVSDLDTALKNLKQKAFSLVKVEKVEAIFKGKRITALNEIQVRNKDPRHALRFLLKINGETKSVIADGLVVSTPYGSAAYYKSLGYKPFSSGLRIGLNNPVTMRRYFVVDKKAIVKILREKAQLIADNQKKIYELKEGESVLIRKSKQNARFVKFL